MDPPELASEPPWIRIGAASNSAPHLTPLGWVMLGWYDQHAQIHVELLNIGYLFIYWK